MVEYRGTGVVGCYVALNHAHDTILGKMICWVQAPIRVLRGQGGTIPTHARLGFLFADGSRAYFEALEGSGFGGPNPEGKVTEWIKRGKGRWTRHYYLDLDVDDAGEIFKRALDHKGYWRYSIIQLLGMYLTIRFGARWRQTPKRVICSEAVARLVWPYIDLQVDGTFEAVTPLSIQKSIVGKEYGVKP